MATDPTNLFDAQFTVQAIDPDGKKFDRVSRIIAHSTALDMRLSLDVATDIYPITSGQQLSLQLAGSLKRSAADARSAAARASEPGELDAEDAGALAAEKDAWRLDTPGAAGIADEFDYVMYGKIFKYDEGHSDIVTVYGSFGGLLMALTGSYRHLRSITVGINVYLLIR